MTHLITCSNPSLRLGVVGFVNKSLPGLAQTHHRHTIYKMRRKRENKRDIEA